MMPRLIVVVWAVMVIAGCTAKATSVQESHHTDPQAILEKLWQWESTTNPMEKIEVAAFENYTLFLETGGRAHMRIDCNQGSGSFKLAQGQLTFGPLMSTRMACPPGSLDSVFLRDLQRVVSFFIDDGRLYLEFPDNSGTMQFRAGS